ncbi:hypothetical protein EVAR_78633_1 [Eumeta japonica]|uniref:Uncharacterized protein n=1 Tax=Eumeta variegata TaxID=151549 RepID=A0A4C1U8M0_EUMVA|nr:hypothetical protein EVAR_78633_1 [Eumeta japonica]
MSRVTTRTSAVGTVTWFACSLVWHVSRALRRTPTLWDSRRLESLPIQIRAFLRLISRACRPLKLHYPEKRSLAFHTAAGRGRREAFRSVPSSAAAVTDRRDRGRNLSLRLRRSPVAVVVVVVLAPIFRRLARPGSSTPACLL